MRTIIALLAAALVTGCAATATPTPRLSPSTRPSPTASPAVSQRYIGVWEPQVYTNFGQVRTFARATGVKPRLILEYDRLGGNFPTHLATEAYQYGATLFVQMQPGNASMASIAAGRYDSEFRAYAAAVKRFGRPVIISFAAEMNGSWDLWGWPHTPPAVWVAGWRHVVSVFRSAGAANAQWLWCVSPLQKHAPSLARYWPGAAFVNWVGIDGYFYFASETFGSVFGPTIAQIRALTADPVLLSETAVGTFPGRDAKIRSLFAGAAQSGIAGIVWFDQTQAGSPYRQDWRLEDNPAALSAFRAAAARYERGAA